MCSKQWLNEQAAHDGPGRYEEALAAYEQAIQLDPNNAITHHLLGQAYRDLGRNEDAERELKLAGQLQSGENSQP